MTGRHSSADNVRELPNPILTRIEIAERLVGSTGVVLANPVGDDATCRREAGKLMAADGFVQVRWKEAGTPVIGLRQFNRVGENESILMSSQKLSNNWHFGPRAKREWYGSATILSAVSNRAVRTAYHSSPPPFSCFVLVFEAPTVFFSLYIFRGGRESRGTRSEI